MDQIKKKYKSSKLVAGILLLIIAAVLFFISMADRFIGVSSDAIDLNEALASDISVGEAYITVGYVYDYFSYYGNDNGTDVESKCYLIPVGEEEIMAIDLDGKNMKAIDRNLDKINAFFETGSDDYDSLYSNLEWLDLKGKIKVLDGQNKMFYDEYIESIGYSEAEQSKYFLNYIFVPNEIGSGTSSGSMVIIFIGLVFLVLAVVFILMGILVNPFSEVEAYGKKNNNLEQVKSKVETLLQSASGRYNVYANDEFFMYVGNGKSKVKFYETKDIIWAYQHITQHRTNGIPTGKTYAMMFKAADGKNFEIPSKKKEIEACQEYFMRLIPDAIFGYSNELEQMYRKERQQMAGEVLRRRRIRLGESPAVCEE